MKQYPIFLMLLFAACPLVAQDAPKSGSSTAQPVEQRQTKSGQADDPIAAMLQLSKSTYKVEVVAASDLLLAAIVAEIEKIENNASMSVEVQLKKLKEVKTARGAFLKDNDNTPSLRTLRSASNKYKRQMAAAKKTLEDVFDDAADEYRKPPLKNFKAVSKVLKDKKAFFSQPDGKEVASEEVGDALGFSPKFNSKNWIASAPKLVKNQEGQLRIAAGKDGNLVLTKKNNFELPAVRLTVAAEADTDAYIIINARQDDGKWLGVTSRIQFVDGKIMAGGQRSDFRPDSGKIKEFKVDEYFKLELKVEKIDGRPDAMMVKSLANSKHTGAIAYSLKRSGEAGAVGFVVKHGAISVKSFELLTE